MFIHELKCRFCQKVTGKLEFKYLLPDNISDQFLDTRCSECENSYGSVKEMEKLFRESKVKGEFEDFIKKTDFKKATFQKEITKELQKSKLTK